MTGKEVTQRLDKLKADAELNKDKLFIIICDEAHSGCTKSTENQNESPSKFFLTIQMRFENMN
jgi:hypothetical protein